jgi:hypothetical protein
MRYWEACVLLHRNTNHKSEVRSQRYGRPPRVGRFLKKPFTSFLTSAFCALTWAAPFAADAATYYVSPSGSDSNPCSQTSPCRTVRQGLTRLSAGDTLYIRGGTYVEGINANNQTVPT